MTDNTPSNHRSFSTKEERDGGDSSWNPSKLFSCCGAGIMDGSPEQILLSRNSGSEIVSKTGTEFEEAAARLLRAGLSKRDAKEKSPTFTSMAHIRQSETWDCGRLHFKMQSFPCF